MTTATGLISVGSGSTVSSITHNLNTNSAVISALTPSWNTTTWVGSKVLNSCTVYFGTQVTSGGGVINWRAES